MITYEIAKEACNFLGVVVYDDPADSKTKEVQLGAICLENDEIVINLENVIKAHEIIVEISPELILFHEYAHCIQIKKGLMNFPHEENYEIAIREIAAQAFAYYALDMENPIERSCKWFISNSSIYLGTFFDKLFGHRDEHFEEQARDLIQENALQIQSMYEAIKITSSKILGEMQNEGVCR